jgi:succinate dehydrogenase / fumarate reductase, cytochrome b subunit
MDIAAAKPRRFYAYSVGKKIVMALAGLILVGFVFGHMVGNLKVYQGPEAFNGYAEGLRTFGAPFLSRNQALFAVRALLLFAGIVHIWAAFDLVLRSRAARKHRYRQFHPEVFSHTSRTMAWGGVVILAFVIYHLLHFTFGTVHPDFVAHNVYYNFIIGFQSWPVSFGYMLAMIPLGFHLYHGVWSAFQTLGLNSPRYNRFRRPLALALAAIVVLGNLTFPLAVLTGVLTLEGLVWT